ncbi:type I-C CRISPR-associated protein Cas5c [Dehalogenimonas sp. THU2]|uniref:type I-C CRISPR-associated protein Cas5c n=1 Tax=Dehalogenimonas sp. THU2 TaxID=3151121 RepID=UPI003218315A
MNQSPVLSLRAKGPLACFTRPELKVERVTYPVITPSAARGILQSVLWKPAIDWHITRISVLSEIKFTSFRRNEVNSKASTPSRSVIENGGEIRPFFIEDDRSQRNTIALQNVDYIIEAFFTMTERAGQSDNLNKFIDMFTRRVEKGQYHLKPYFGCREFAADILPAADAPPPIPDSRDLGIMLWDIDYRPEYNRPIFFRARLEAGAMTVPDLAGCLEQGGDK